MCQFFNIVKPVSNIGGKFCKTRKRKQLNAVTWLESYDLVPRVERMLFQGGGSGDMIANHVLLHFLTESHQSEQQNSFQKNRRVNTQRKKTPLEWRWKKAKSKIEVPVTLAKMAKIEIYRSSLLRLINLLFWEPSIVPVY